MFLWYRFVPLFLNVSISDASSGSTSSNSPHLGRSPSKYSNKQNGSASSSCITFFKPSIAFSDALISDLHTESSLLHARHCHSWSTLQSEDKRNGSKNDAIKIRKIIYIYNQLIFLPNGKFYDSINDAIKIKIYIYVYIYMYIYNQLYSTKNLKIWYGEHTNSVPGPLQNASPNPVTCRIWT